MKVKTDEKCVATGSLESFTCRPSTLQAQTKDERKLSRVVTKNALMTKVKFGTSTNMNAATELTFVFSTPEHATFWFEC